MTPENFCYWLRGWFELNSTLNKGLETDPTLKMIDEHLSSVFKPKEYANLGYQINDTKLRGSSEELYC